MRKMVVVLILFLMGQSIIGQDINDVRFNQPKNLSATSNGSTVTIKWTSANDGIRIYRSETGHEPWVRPSGGKFVNSARQFTDTDKLKSNNFYYYAIESFDGKHRSPLSTFIRIKLGDSKNGFPDNKEGPINVRATRVGNDVRINWDWKAGPTIKGFKLERAVLEHSGDDKVSWAGNEWNPARIVSNPNARSFTDKNVGPDVYVYRVFAYTSSKNLTFSENTEIKVTDGTTSNQLTVSPSNRNVSSSSGNTTFDVSSNVSWTVSESVSWITSVSSASGSNNGRFTVNFNANGTTSERSGTIRVTGGGITRNVTVTQAGSGVTNQLTVTPSNRNVSNSSGNTTFTVSSDVSWTVSESVSWITSVSPASGSNNGSFAVNYSANGTTSQRTGTITVSGGGITRNVTVTQAASNDIPSDVMPIPQNVTATVVGGTIRVDWQMPNTTNVTGFKLVRQFNSGASQRPKDGKIRNANARSFTDEANLPDGTYSYMVRAYYTSGGEMNYPLSEPAVAKIPGGDVTTSLTVSPSNRNVSNSSGNTTFGVTSNVSWTVSESVSWITSVSPASGSNNGSFTVNYSANGTTNQRTGTITVSGSGITRNVTVTQSATNDDPSDVMPIPQNVTATVVGGRIRVDWQMLNTAHVTGFKVVRQYNSGAWGRPIGGKIRNANARSYTDKANLPDGTYSYKVRAYYSSGSEQNYPLSEAATIVLNGNTAISQIPSKNELEVVNEVPKENTLFNNYPNPFNPSTKIKFSLVQPEAVNLIIYNIMGEEVMRIIDNKKLGLGNHEVEVNMNNLASGMYVYRLSAGKFIATNRMILTK